MQFSKLKLTSDTFEAIEDGLNGMLSGGARDAECDYATLKFDKVITALIEYCRDQNSSKIAGQRGQELTVAIFKAVI